MSITDAEIDPPDDPPGCSGCFIAHAPADCPVLLGEEEKESDD